MLFEEIYRLEHKPALKLFFVLETQFFHARLALRAVLPANLGRFVAADVEISAGEELNHLAEHIKDELQRIVVSGAEDIIKDALLRADLEGLALAGELGIGGEHGERVAGHIELGDNFNIVVVGICDYFADLILCEISGIFLCEMVLAEIRAAAAGADCDELGVAVNFNAPALVVGQMPVHGVHFDECGGVDELFDVLDRRHVARAVEHECAVFKCGRVLDSHARADIELL